MVLTVNRRKLGYEDSGIFLQNLNATRINICRRVLQSFIMIECVLMKLELAMRLAGEKSRSFCRGVLTVNRHKLGYEDTGIFLQNLNANRNNMYRRVLQSYIMIERDLMKIELPMRRTRKKSRSFCRGGPDGESTCILA